MSAVCAYERSKVSEREYCRTCVIDIAFTFSPFARLKAASDRCRLRTRNCTLAQNPEGLMMKRLSAFLDVACDCGLRYSVHREVAC